MTDYITLKKFRKGAAGIVNCIHNVIRLCKNEGRRISALTKFLTFDFGLSNASFVKDETTQNNPQPARITRNESEQP